MENRRKTTNYFPEPRFQFRFLRFLLAGALVQIATTCAILFYFLKENYELLIQYAALPQEIVAILDRELWILVGMVGITFFLYLVGISLLGILFSHRIAGVIYALKRTIRDLSMGHEAQLKIRQGDEFQELIDGFNHLVRDLRTGKIQFSSEGSGKKATY